MTPVIRKHFLKNILAGAVGVAVMGITLPGVAADANAFKDAIANGNLDLNFRYRVETVDQDNALEDATASTLKSRLSYTTQAYNNFQARIQVDDVHVIGDDNHNDTENGETDHSVVPDPQGTEVNEAWIAYTGLDNTTVKYGRQLVNLDNQRFIGGVAWRQNEQTHDALAIVNTSLPDTTIVYAYVINVNTITEANLDTDTNLLNINYKGLPFGTLSVYAYEIEVANDTYGVRLAGSPKVGDLQLHYELEYATQEEHHDFQTAYDADYTHMVLGATLGPLTAKLGQEVLGSDDGVAAFQTPLATKHKFNGWADQFLGTPADGLEDNYLTLAAQVLSAKVTVTYHDFEADEGSNDYGDELDIAIGKKLTDNADMLLKFADYSAEDGGKVDTQKLWLQFNLKF